MGQLKDEGHGILSWLQFKNTMRACDLERYNSPDMSIVKNGIAPSDI